ncbi:hypothetical protein [Nocardioides pacificus]
MTTPTDQSADEWADQLTEQLAELADEAPLARLAPELWDRGRRYQRLRRGGTVLIAAAACLALVLLGTVVERRDADPTPAPAGGPIGLPDRIFSPSPWLPGTDDAGPLGQLIAVVQAERGGWWGATPGAVGISATTGEYRFLDLPDHARATDVALAPDGRHVAYWTSGRTTRSPHSLEEDLVTGLAVLDTTSEEVARHPLRSEHGFVGESLLWTDTDDLVFAAAEALAGVDAPEEEQGAYLFSVPQVWSPTGDLVDGPRVVPDYTGGDLGGKDSSGRLLLEGKAGRHRVVDPWQGQVATIVAPQLQFPVVDPTGERVAGIHRGPGGYVVPGKMTAATLGPPSVAPDGPTRTARLTRIPGNRNTYAVLGWTSPQHAAALQLSAREEGGIILAEVDVRDGARRILTRVDNGAGPASFATDLLTAPVVDAQKPPAPMDPRWVAALATLGVLAGVGGIIWWRRRVRP